MRHLVLVLVALSGAAPAPAQTPTVGSWRDAVRRLRDAPSVLAAHDKKPGTAPIRAASVGSSFTTVIAESEPNNTVPTADSVALGDRASGVVNPEGDVDTWFVDVTAGTFLSVDVDAKSIGSLLDPVLALIAPDGTTLLAVNDDFDGFDSRISYRVTRSGRYFVQIRAFGDLGFPVLTYAINFGTVTCDAAGLEQEPNDGPGTATPLAIGAAGSGELCARDDNPAGDVDYWAFTGPAGTTIELDIDVANLGLLADPAIALYASDGTTRVAFNDDADGLDSRLQYSIVTTGTYYAAVATLTDPGGNPFPYTLHIRSIPPGPGDPITVRAEGLGLPLGLAAGSTGDLFVGDVAGDRVVRVSGQGVVATFAAGIPSPLGLAWDAFGHLLVASGDGVVYRVTPQGQATSFITDAGAPFWIAVAPDGRIWLSDVADRTLRRYSPTGEFEVLVDAGDIGGIGPGPLAVGPSGELYFSNGTDIWKLVDGEPQRVFGGPFLIWAFAFDVAGNVYAPAPAAGLLQMFGPTGTVVADPFAVGPDAAQAVAFGRDATGATVARVFATEFQIGRLIEVNPAGVAHRGHTVGYVPPPLTVSAAAASLLGAGALAEAEVQYLDALGNHNGRYDVGDFQAYLRTVGAPAGATAAQAKRGRDR